MSPTEVGRTALCAHDYPKVEISTYKCMNELELVLCKVDNPLYSAYVVVPTFIEDDRGLPHTLEHLIFCGSYGYPERGYLDRLATLCQGAGTNAYTTEDHTCYTFTTSSLPGLLRLLPVFLDHIFRPTLDPCVVQREVFHKDPNGEGKGVVYCEMVAREWSEQDQLDLALRKSVFAQSGRKELDVYRWEYGGATRCLAKLQVEEIMEYHQRYYRPGNTTIILCGGANLYDRSTDILAMLETTEFLSSSSSPTTDLVPKLSSFDKEEVESRKLSFPSNDESLGSVGIAWIGPTSDDTYTITALHILMRMLKDTSASPLYQHFVERSEPIASDIDYDIKPSYLTMISLIFSGVPTPPVSSVSLLVKEENISKYQFLDAHALHRELSAFLNIWRKDEDAIKRRLQIALKSIAIKFQEALEDDPHEVCATYCVPEIVRTHWPFSRETPAKLPYGETISQFPIHLNRLSKEPMSFWRGLLDQYILESAPVEVRMYPSKEMNNQIKGWEMEQLEGIPRIDLTPETDNGISDISEIILTAPKSISCQISSVKSENLMVVAVPNTNVQRLTIAFDIVANVPKEFWPCLVLFQELMFQSDINLTEEIVDKYRPPSILKPGVTPYQVLIGDLASQFSTFEAAVGFDNELFSVGYFDSHLIVSLHGRVPFELDQLKTIAYSIICGTVFKVERIEEIFENLISQLKDSWRDPLDVIDAILVERLLHHGNSIDNSTTKRRKPIKNKLIFVENYVGLMKQTEFLIRVRDLLETNPNELIVMLERLRSYLLNSPKIINYGTGSEMPLPLDDGNSGELLGYTLPKHGLLEGSILNDDELLEIIPIADITASFMTVVIPLDILPFPNPDHCQADVDKLLCTAMLCQLISYTEGPLYRRIRGEGLAYGASFSIAIWNGLLSFDLNDSIDPIKSLGIFTELVREVLNEAQKIMIDGQSGSLLNRETILTSQAVQLYQFVAERSTPASIVSTALRCRLRGLPQVGTIEESDWNNRLLQLGLTDIAAWASEILPAFLDPKKCLKLLAVPSSRLEMVCADLTNAQIPFSINDITKLSAKLEY